MPDAEVRRDEEHGPIEAVAELARREAAEYSHGEPHPLGGYLGVLGMYAASVTAGTVLARVLGRRVPKRVAAGDLALIAVATFRLARIMAKDPVTSPVRAPFTRFAGVSGPSELHEEVRGDGFRHAVGELLTCPFCLGHWIATTFAFGLVLEPDVTRLVAATMTAEAAADFLQFAYSAVEQKVG